MEAASVPTDGNEPQETQEPPAPSVPPEVSQRLDELSGRFDQFEPVLGQIAQQFQQPQEQEPEPDYWDEESGTIDPDGFAEALRRQTRQEFEQELSPLMQEVDQLRNERELERFEQLKTRYPELADPAVDGEIAREAQQWVDRYGGQVDHKLIETLYLARSARKQAQQEVPAGGQEVALEAGSAAPGQPEADPTLERWDGYVQRAQSGPWGKSIDEL